MKLVTRTANDWKSWLVVQSPPTRTDILVRVAIMLIVKGQFRRSHRQAEVTVMQELPTAIIITV